MKNCIKKTNTVMFGWIFDIPMPKLLTLLQFGFVAFIVVVELWVGYRLADQFATYVWIGDHMIVNSNGNMFLHVFATVMTAIIVVVTVAYAVTLRNICNKEK